MELETQAQVAEERCSQLETELLSTRHSLEEAQAASDKHVQVPTTLSRTLSNYHQTQSGVLLSLFQCCVL